MTEYTLPRDSSESQRLERQHFLIAKNVGYLLNPSIASQLGPYARIADVGCGTGIWMRSLAEDSPLGWDFTGFDISSDQFPPLEKRGHCTYEILNVLNGVPETWKSSFDMVNIRYLIAGLRSDQWSQAATTAKTLLKPGGFIQWHESNFVAARVVRDMPNASTTNMKRVWQLSNETHQACGMMGAKDVVELGNMLASVGFQDVREDVVSSDRVAETREGATTAVLQSLRPTLRRFSRQDGFCLTPDEVEGLFQRAEEEIKDGKVYGVFDMHIVTGRKPVDD